MSELTTEERLRDLETRNESAMLGGGKERQQKH